MLTVRVLTAQDRFDEVGRVYAESWKASYKGILPQHYLDKMTHDRWDSTLRANPDASLVLYLDDKLIGTTLTGFALTPDRAGYGEIIAIYLLPEYTGKGYGKPLMKAALEKLSGEGCSAVCLWALSQNTRAEKFYQHMGFSRTGKKLMELYGDEEFELTEFSIDLA